MDDDHAQLRARRAATADSNAGQAPLERALVQTRRLDSVGHLVTGVAHDFNNLLAVILNLAIAVAETLPAGSQARHDVDEITRAAARAAKLTRRLLSFSRRDAAEPEVFIAGGVVLALEDFLRRSLGEQIELEVAVADDRSPVCMDRHELEQILVNLVVNARDAMPGGGRMTIETRVTQVEVDSGDAGFRLPPGDYVTLTVSDTGIGMGAAVAERAFEPFFTTKPATDGSGLGLSTVYGIVAHLGGRVVLDSEPDRGTTVQVHLPASALRHDADAEPHGDPHGLTSSARSPANPEDRRRASGGP